MMRRVAGAVASFLATLAGLWLILAPFALGTQPKNADWTHETFTNVWSGIGLGVLGLIGVVGFTTALLQNLRNRGLITPRPAKNQTGSAAAATQSATTEPASAAPSASHELDQLIAPLVTALTTDLDRDDRQAARPSDHGRGPTETSASNNSTRQPARADN